MDAEDRRAEWAEVAAAERAALSRAGEPVTDTAGLALSGGGVRSATFALGVLDELKRAGLLKKLHYLSTVSGGSHIGAWLVVNCARAAARNDDWLKPDADWSASIRRLRSAAAATSRSDWWSTIAASLFTTVIATVTVILSMASVLLIAPIAFSGFLAWPNAGHWRWLMVLLPVQAVVISAASQLSSASPNAGVEGRAWRPATIAAVTGVAIAWAVGLTTEFDPFPSDQLDYRAAFPIAALILLAGFLSVPAASRLVATIGSRWPASREPAATINLTSSWVQAIVILPLMVTAYLITATLWSSNRPEYYEFSGVVSTAWRSPSFPVVVFVASLWLIASCSVRRRGPRSALAVATAGALTTGVLYIVLCVIILWLNYARATGPWGPLHAVVWGPPFVAFGFALAVMFLIGIIGREAPSGVRDWWYRMSTWLALYAVGWLVIGAAAVYVPSLVSAWLNVNPWTAITVSIGAATTVAVGLAAARAHGLRERSPLKVWSENVALLAPAVYFAAMTVGVSALLNGLLGVYGEPAPVAADAASLPAFAEGPVIGVSAVMLTVCVTLTLLFATRFDVNEFSLNAAYRTRLVRRYLGATRFRPGERQPQNFTGLDDRDDFELSRLTASADAGSPPLLLINCSVDGSGQGEAARATGPFVMSPLYCGSAQPVSDLNGFERGIGFVPTASYGGSQPPTVGQAMCISGAAENPLAGHHRYLPVAVLMALFNQRLGWWLPNPLAGKIVRGSPLFGMASLLGELLGTATLHSRFIRVSDGGRFEILGMYKLVRRRCRVIIVSDAEPDPTLTFAGLVRAIRRCEDEFNVKIDLDLNLVRPDGNGPNRQPFTVGTITYEDGARGWIIYLKAVMTGHEDTALRQFHAGHPEFPHEAIGDHFSSSDQFDSYYRLGRHVVRRTFARVADRSKSAASWDIVQLATKLATGKNGVPRILISYRREDSSGYVNHLTEHLGARFGRDNVFRDLSSIPTGSDFVETLSGTLKSCDATLVVIGRSWLTATGADGQRRLNQPGDFVRLEIAESLKRDILVCPLLVGGAAMPDAKELPVDLAPLASRQAFAVVDVSFEESVCRLMDTLAQA